MQGAIPLLKPPGAAAGYQKEQSLKSVKVPALSVINDTKGCGVLDHNHHSPTSSKMWLVAQREGKSPALPGLAFFLFP